MALQGCGDTPDSVKSPRWVIHSLSALARQLSRWYVIAPVMIGLGIAAGVLAFLYLTPGKPQIGVIQVPYTVINDRSAFAIERYLDYARRDDSIKAVVISLSSPGGGAAASERLYNETRRLRDEKPVVLVMGNLVASGGYMMSMGASYSYVQTASLVGNVGVIFTADPLVPELPEEDLVFSSPRKLDGGTRREWIEAVDILKEAFVQTVVSERGDRLRISGEELGEARLYTGLVAVRLGLADELGSYSDAVEKAAALAGISSYEFVDVNLEVLRELAGALDFVLPNDGEDESLLSGLSVLSGVAGDGEGQLSGGETEGALEGLRTLRDLMLDQGLGAEEEDPLPGFPIDIHRPDFYYLYVGNDP